MIHEIYEETSGEFGQGARRLPVPVIGGRRGLKREPVPWDKVPDANKVFLTELADRLLDALLPEPIPADPGTSRAEILIAAAYDSTTRMSEGECADIADAQLEALADAGYAVVARADVQIAWSWASEMLAHIHPDDLLDKPHLQQARDALARLHALLTYACPPDQRADDEATFNEETGS